MNGWIGDARLIEICGEAFVTAIERQVGATLLGRRDMGFAGFDEAPVIGDRYQPRFTFGKPYTDLKQRIVRARLARKWFEHEAPGLPQLPLRETECRELLDDADPELRFLGRYGLMLRSVGWQPPFPPLPAELSI